MLCIEGRRSKRGHYTDERRGERRMLGIRRKEKFKERKDWIREGRVDRGGGEKVGGTTRARGGEMTGGKRREVR